MRTAKRTPRIALLLTAFLPCLAQGQRVKVAPIHPDTLPTLMQSWRLPASLAPFITNAYAPRLSVGNDILYVFDHHGRRLVAVNPTTGRVRWHSPVPSRSDRAFAITPVMDQGQVFVANDGYVYSFSAKKGKMNWRLGTKGVALNGFALSKHYLVFPWLTIDGVKAAPGIHLWAVDSRRGQVEWSRKFPGQSAYVLGDLDGIYFINDGGVVIGLTADRGDPRWQMRIKGTVSKAPLLDKGVIYLSSQVRKAGWFGTEVAAIEAKSGKILWQVKLPSANVITAIAENRLLTVESSGRLTQFGPKGEKMLELELGFGEEPTSMVGTTLGNRAFIFAHQSDGNGYIRLVDLEKKKVLAVANALDLDARSMVAANKMLLLDGQDGNVYAYRLDRSQQPKRAVVPPEEFAAEMLTHASKVKVPRKGLADRLAGLGPKALGPIEAAMESANPYVAEAATQAVGYLAIKQSVPALLKALTKQIATPQSRVDPVVSLIDALATLADGRAIPILQKVMKDEGQCAKRRRAAYVALGAINSPVSLAPLWAYRGMMQVPSTRWQPQAFTPSFDYKVEDDVEVGPENWPEEIRQTTSKTVQNQAGQVFSIALAPYLGGYNDIWFGRSDLSGIITEPYFTALTKPEVTPNKRLRFKKISLDKDGTAEIIIETQLNNRWMEAKPIKLALGMLLQDSDRDKLPDLVERRLHLCVYDSDCDGDGLSDGEDLNPLASGRLVPTAEQLLFREAFFTFYTFIKRRGIVVVDPGEGPSFELYGRKDPILSLRRTTIEKFRKQAGLHAIDFVSFGGPYPEGAGSGDALPDVVWNKKKTEATIGMDIFRSADNTVAFNVTLKKSGKNWVVTRFFRVWTTNAD
jgi:outer membrane protein assembly factor BamB